jgi:hypothetical protein
MIWFACKQCGKVHGRAESSIGTMVFCECGQGNLVPWESTVSEPAGSEVPAAPPRLEPLAFEPPLVPASPPPIPRRGRRRTAFPKPDPNFCLNHDKRPPVGKCADCGEAFCGDCLVTMQGKTLCGPCKNFRIRKLHRPPKVSSLALIGVILAMAVVPLSFCLPVLNASVIGLLPLLGELTALALAVLGFRETEVNPRVTGRSLAITGMLTAVVAVVLNVLLALYVPRPTA